MRYLKDFNDFVKEGIIRKVSPDFSRADSLIKEAKKSYSFMKEIVRKIKITNENSTNLIKNIYDIIMELIRAKMLKDGFKSSGIGAHEAEISYLRKLNFSESDVQFANQLRYFRNGIMYYGKSFDSDYTKKYSLFWKKFIEN